MLDFLKRVSNAVGQGLYLSKLANERIDPEDFRLAVRVVLGINTEAPASEQAKERELIAA